MNCPKCSAKMILLFTSYVCDNCNPPKGAVNKPIADKSSSTMTLDDLIKALEAGNSVPSALVQGSALDIEDIWIDDDKAPVTWTFLSQEESDKVTAQLENLRQAFENACLPVQQPGRNVIIDNLTADMKDKGLLSFRYYKWAHEAIKEPRFLINDI